MKKTYLLFLILWTILQPVTPLSASEWNNFIIHYPKEIHGNGAQTWNITATDYQWTYFANQNGLLQFNGNEWSSFPLHNSSDVRSVYLSPVQKKIFVGGINEFGYFQPNVQGLLEYTCLSDSLSGDNQHIANVWSIYEQDNILYFVCDYKIIKYLKGNFTLLYPQGKIDCANLIDGTLYVSTDKGLYILAGNTFLPLQGAESLNNKRIRGILSDENGLLIVTAYNGLYRFKQNQLIPYVTGAESFLRENEIFSVASSTDYIALGTVHKGILLIRKSNRQLKYFNESNNLSNNTVLSIAFDRNQNLWAGLDNGIDYVFLESSLTNLYSFPSSLGAGYAAFLTDGKLYLGTNRALYSLSYPIRFGEEQPAIRQIPGSSGQVWKLRKIGSDLFCLHDRGLFLVRNDHLERIGEFGGVWDCQPFLGDSNRMYIGVYNGIYVAEKQDHHWKIITQVEGFTESANNFEQENPYVLWLHHTNHGLIRLQLDSLTYAVQTATVFSQGKELPPTRSIFVNRIRDSVYFTTPHGVFRYDPATGDIIPAEEMQALSEENNFYERICQSGENTLAISRKNIRIMAPDNTLLISLERPKISFIKDFIQLYPLNDSLTILPYDNGFALLQMMPQKQENHSVYIKSVHISYPNDSLLYTHNFLNQKYAPEISYTWNTLRFEYALQSHNDLYATYRYRLNNQPWSDYSRHKTKEYSNLPEGTYTFQVEAMFYDGTNSMDEFNFTILPPWYRTYTAYMIYLLLIFLTLFFIYRWDKTRLQRQRKRAVLEKDRELIHKKQEYEKENAKKEQQIIELEKEKLAYELKHKSQELANMMINIAQKNENLAQIKEELTKIISSMNSNHISADYQQMLVAVNHKIDADMQAVNVLKRIEEQFDLIHNNYMKRLHERYPDLSLNERMMCAYIKMDLSSKEIAGLLNLSLRGVETLRYRIRKKFDLGRDEKLSEYLNKI